MGWDGAEMKSLIEDFGDIKARLAEIEREKLAEAMETKIEEAAPENPTWAYIPTPVHSIEDMFCA